jgi:hypothetical protein
MTTKKAQPLHRWVCADCGIGSIRISTFGFNSEQTGVPCLSCTDHSCGICDDCEEYMEDILNGRGHFCNKNNPAD